MTTFSSAPLEIYSNSKKSVFEWKVIYNVDKSRGKATTDNLKFMREQYGVNNNNNNIILSFTGVGSNLKNRLSTDLSQNMEIQQKEMMDRMTALLPPEKQTVRITHIIDILAKSLSLSL